MDTCCTAEQLALLGITAQSVGLAFAAGFTPVLTCFLIGFAGHAFRRAVRGS